MKLVIPKGSTSRIVTVFIQANNVTTGAGLASLIHTSLIVGGYVREGGTGVALAVDEDVATEGTYDAPSAAGKVKIGTPANMRAGTYELHFHDDLWATGAETVTITLGGATNMADLAIEVQLSDPVRGLGAPTALPNAASSAAGGLVTLLEDIPTNAELNLRTQPTADYFDPATDTVANVTNLTSLPSIPANWITAAGIAADAITAAKIADGAIDAATFAAGAINAAAIATDAIGAAEISAAAANKLADHIRRRTQANVETSSDGDALDYGSLYGLIQQGQESNTVDSPGNLRVYRTNGSTILATRPITTDATADPVTGIT